MNIKIFTDNIENEALGQIYKLVNLPQFKDCKIRIMPDVHAGAGCVIGFTANLGDKVIPNIVGVDIGCGMLTTELGNINLDLEKLDKIIRENVPSGFEVHEQDKYDFPRLKDLRCYKQLKDVYRLERSIGTLGGGNHFMEIDIDEDNNKYLVIHTGSRNLGKQVAEYYQDMADQLCNYAIDECKNKKTELIKLYKEQGRQREIQSALENINKEYQTNRNNIPKELAYLEGQYREDYLHDMKICQEYAKLNRQTIANIICKKIGLEKFDEWETVHNYIDIDTNMIRKGAVDATKDKKLLIPINMRDGSLICIGKGNDDWNCSAPHGAGRIMSRMKAKETISLEDYKESMNGIYTTSVNECTIDEAPMVYKPMEEIINNIQDTVDIIKTIKPIYNFKASDETK